MHKIFLLFIFNVIYAGEFVYFDTYTADDGTSLDSFGVDVAIHNNNLVVGASNDDGHRGSAYVFSYDGSTWNQVKKLLAISRFENAYFGKSVDIHNNIVVVGASGYNMYTGEAFIFSGSSWNQVERLVDGHSINYDRFGYDVAVYDNVVAVGAVGESCEFLYSGAVYVFDNDGNQVQKLIGPEKNGKLGHSVAIYNNTLVGAAVSSGAESDPSCKVYVYNYNGTLWQMVQILIPSNGFIGDDFGKHISIYGSNLVVTNGNGSAYIFNFEGSSWNEIQILHLGPNGAIAQDVSIQNNILAVKTFLSAFVFMYNGSNWNQVQEVTDFLCYHVCIHNNNLVIGDDRDNTYTGAIHVLEYFCWPGNYSNSQYICSQCTKNETDCIHSYLGGSCDGYDFPSDPSCIPCTPISSCLNIECSTISDQTCSQCSAGYFRDNSDTECSLCAKVEADCVNSYLGIICDGFDQSDVADCLPCSNIENCPAGNTECSSISNQTCSQCDAGYFRNNSDTECSLCTKVESECVNSYLDCDGSYQSDECLPCSEITNCPAGNTECSTISDQTCSRCDAGYFRDNSDTECSLCTKVESECVNSYLDCDGSYQSDECLPCSEITNCPSGNTECSTISDQTCVQCDAGYFRNNSDTECSLCTKVEADCVNSYLRSCDGSYRSEECLPCNSIANCPAGNTECSTISDQKCSQCNAGYFRDNSDTKCSQCTKIEFECVNSYLDCDGSGQSDGTCLPCSEIANCPAGNTECSTISDQKCSQCNAGYFRNTSDTECSLCGVSCVNAYPTGSCDGYSQYDTSICVPCTSISGCLNIECTNSSDHTCRQCSPGYFRDNNDTECSLCTKSETDCVHSYLRSCDGTGQGDECLPCSEITNCIDTECSTISDQLCNRCRRGYFRDPSLKECHRCTKNEDECVNSYLNCNGYPTVDGTCLPCTSIANCPTRQTECTTSGDQHCNQCISEGFYITGRMNQICKLCTQCEKYKTRCNGTTKTDVAVCDEEKSHHSSSLSAGAAAGIAVGCIALFMSVGVGVVVWKKRMVEKETPEEIGRPLPQRKFKEMKEETDERIGRQLPKRNFEMNKI